MVYARRLVGTMGAGEARYALEPDVLWVRWLGEREGGPSARGATFIDMVYEMVKQKITFVMGPDAFRRCVERWTCLWLRVAYSLFYRHTIDFCRVARWRGRLAWRLQAQL